MAGSLSGAFTGCSGLANILNGLEGREPIVKPQAIKRKSYKLGGHKAAAAPKSKAKAAPAAKAKPKAKAKTYTDFSLRISMQQQLRLRPRLQQQHWL